MAVLRGGQIGGGTPRGGHKGPCYAKQPSLLLSALPSVSTHMGANLVVEQLPFLYPALGSPCAHSFLCFFFFNVLCILPLWTCFLLLS